MTDLSNEPRTYFHQAAVISATGLGPVAFGSPKTAKPRGLNRGAPANQRGLDDRDTAFDIPSPPPAISLVEARRRLRCHHPAIETEAEWRGLRHFQSATESPQRVAVSRWHALEDGTREVCAENADDNHLVKIILRSMNLRISIDGKCVHDGVATPGMLHVTGPGASAQCLFRGPYDTLHLYVSDALIAECLQDMPVRPGPLMAAGRGLVSDPTIERLGRTLLAANQYSGTLAPLYADCVSIAIVARLLSAGRGDGSSGGPAKSGLANWRLKRTIDYIEVRLGEAIKLADMAEVAGLTQMHFAAQFRASTGLRPHEYLLRRRVERAQEMLLVAGLSVVDAAFSVGFQSQSHFTATFARFVGETPHAWRVSQGVRRSGR
jgi:AraC family transcriptional regulator